MGAQELLIVLIIVLVLFGGSQLPKLARSLGQARREFEDGQGSDDSSDDSSTGSSDDGSTAE